MPGAAIHSAQGRSLQPWLRVVAIAGGTFVMVTSEFLPIGLLSPMAHDLGVSEGRAGLMVTMPGMVAAVSAPLLASIAGRFDRRILLLSMSLLIILADLVVASAFSLLTILLGRMILGAALGGFWALAASAGRKLVPEADGNRAIALILGGISIGTVAGVPLGTFVGEIAGWRAAFASVAVLGGAMLVAQGLLLPPIPGDASASIRSLFYVARVSGVQVGYAAAALTAAGHFAAYTYLQPFLAVSGWNEPIPLTVILASYGIAGIAGTWTGERVATRSAGLGFAAVAFLVGVAIELAVLAQGFPWIVAVAVVLWGAAFGALPVCVQIWTFEAAPAEFEAGSALMVTVFQIAVAGGALLGGRLVDGPGVRVAFAVGGALAVTAAVVLMAFILMRHVKFAGVDKRH